MRVAGDLRARLKFQRRLEGVDDGYGNVISDWNDLGVERYCDLRPTRGDEVVTEARLTGTALWDCWLRSDAGTRQITPADRAIDVRTGQTFNIRFAADMDGKAEWLLLTLESGVADG